MRGFLRFQYRNASQKCNENGFCIYMSLLDYRNPLYVAFATHMALSDELSSVAFEFLLNIVET